MSSAGGWHPDPYRRAEQRFYDGTQWTSWVTSRGSTWDENAMGGPVAPSPLPPPTADANRAIQKWLVWVGVAVVLGLIVTVIAVVATSRSDTRPRTTISLAPATIPAAPTTTDLFDTSTNRARDVDVVPGARTFYTVPCGWSFLRFNVEGAHASISLEVTATATTTLRFSLRLNDDRGPATVTKEASMAANVPTMINPLQGLSEGTWLMRIDSVDGASCNVELGLMLGGGLP